MKQAYFRMCGEKVFLSAKTWAELDILVYGRAYAPLRENVVYWETESK